MARYRNDSKDIPECATSPALNASPTSAAYSKAFNNDYKQEASAILKRQQAKRFSGLDEDTVSRIHNASLEQIETWADRVLDAKTLDDMLGGQSFPILK